MEEKKSILVSFRLTETEFKPYESLFRETNLTKTEFFRGVFLSKKYEFTVNENRPVDYQKLVFLFNKSSNNINQVAYKLNDTHRNGTVSESLYRETLNRLISIESLMQRVIDDC
ncbi:plasmid mobilization protein [Enterovibrio calviensis]|uniref:plasmid mobilization protein n=1 Tax=Enterovibrio calviensis TaxID=91359 RepID=UPI00373661FD